MRIPDFLRGPLVIASLSLGLIGCEHKEEPNKIKTETRQKTGDILLGKDAEIHIDELTKKKDEGNKNGSKAKFLDPK